MKKNIFIENSVYYYMSILFIYFVNLLCNNNDKIYFNVNNRKIQLN